MLKMTVRINLTFPESVVFYEKFYDRLVTKKNYNFFSRIDEDIPKSKISNISVKMPIQAFYENRIEPVIILK